MVKCKKEARVSQGWGWSKKITESEENHLSQLKSKSVLSEEYCMSLYHQNTSESSPVSHTDPSSLPGWNQLVRQVRRRMPSKMSRKRKTTSINTAVRRKQSENHLHLMKSLSSAIRQKNTAIRASLNQTSLSRTLQKLNLTLELKILKCQGCPGGSVC